MMGYEGYDNTWTLSQLRYYKYSQYDYTSLAPLSYHNYIQQIYPLKSRSLSTLTNYTP